MKQARLGPTVFTLLTYLSFLTGLAALFHRQFKGDQAFDSLSQAIINW